MKRVLPILLLVFSILILDVANAQNLKLPQPSSTQTITQDFGLGTIKITYSRPNVKGRQIFGGLVPYGQVWRTGANSATVISFSEDVEIEGHNVPAGDYALFTIPKENEWMVILNKDTKQWGAYTHKESDDVLRFTAKPVKLSDKVETFSIQLENVYPTTAQLKLAWDRTAVSLNLKADVDTKAMASINEAMKGEKKPYMQAAQYYYDNNKDLKKALEWINAAEAAEPKAPWVKYWKARIQLKGGDKNGAARTAEAGIAAAKTINNEEYVRLNSQVLGDAKK